MTVVSGSCVAAVVLLAWCGQVQAQSDLDAKLKRLNDTLQADAALSADVKAALSDFAAAAAAAAEGGGGLGAWADKLKWYGDFRLRHETDFHLHDREDRNRERVRLRVGGTYQVNDELLVGARVLTGSVTDENSPHQNLGGTFDKFTLSLDRAFATWKPPAVKGLWVTGGKFSHPIDRNPVYDQLVWDEDVQPTGVAMGRAYDSFKWMAGEYLILDNATSGTLESAAVFVAQVSSWMKVGDSDRLTGALTVYRYGQLNPDDINGSRLFGENLGNATIDTTGDAVPDDYASRFTIWNPYVAYETAAGGKPLVLGGEYVWNSRAQVSGDQGFGLGLKWGAAKAKGDWQVYYHWQTMQQDATLSNFTNDDFLFGTNYRGSLIGARWQCLDQVELHFWGSAMRVADVGPGAETDADGMQYRFRTDLNIRF